MIRGVYLSIAAILMCCMFARIATAQSSPYNFAVFSDVAGSRPFSFTNDTTFGQVSVVSAPVTFNFSAPTGLSTANRPATLNISSGLTSVATVTPASVSGATENQPIGGVTTTLALTEVSTGKNLLSMTFSGNLLGTTGGSSAQLSGSDGTSNLVTFTSDYLTLQRRAIVTDCR
jgi:hypothetical protein